MTDDRSIDDALAALGTDEVPLGAAFRARLLEDAARETAPAPAPRRRWHLALPELMGLAGLPLAAACGLAIGLANPSLVLAPTPWAETAEATAADDGTLLLADVFAGWDPLAEDAQ
ncbi:hypothetical protein [Jannaschia sp. W003]|uniref:hypothetical protein n=1 Tax=Jannaschia sp. W003 TaxID=2867012 RepID=UPI0021A857F7|nr:hypothetical protein [Jannaschia sp. W003]UWQ21159.1 hypothetical protein K3554_14470 [Jannaschia sp. W003]